MRSQASDINKVVPISAFVVVEDLIIVKCTHFNMKQVQRDI